MSAGILAIIIIVRLAKLVIDTIIHGYALDSIYGWSLHLLGALWASVTSLLLHLGKSTPTDAEKEKYHPAQTDNHHSGNNEKSTPPEENEVNQSHVSVNTATLNPSYATLRDYLYRVNTNSNK